ncbi:hypothetical protein TFLX_05458 [Thermoflexales bacterium]|nr:hypothetical protein TFLX_05458 [Thermoflexales bacterium]
MIGNLLLYCASLLLVVWGVAHLFPTKNVVKGFGAISLDNQRIIAMEWINEGVTLIFSGVLTAAVTLVDPASLVARIVYWLTSVMLNALSVISLFTGFRVNFLPYRLCPIIFTGTSILILLGMYL